jgi:hypothetical protein
MLTGVPASNGTGRGKRTELWMPNAEPVSSPVRWRLKEASSAYALSSELPLCYPGCRTLMPDRGNPRL